MTAPERHRFWRIAAAGACFQAGSTAVDSATVISGLVYQLTGSTVLVGLASTLLRLGWLLPQLLIGHLAQQRRRRMPFYLVGAFGRATAMAALALLMGFVHGFVDLVWGFFALWTVYAFVSGIVAVPYNDIVARAIPSKARSRMLAWRFFVGGALALTVAALIRRWLGSLSTLDAYALIFATASLLMLVSTAFFWSAGEVATTLKPPRKAETFHKFLFGSVATWRKDRRFRLFLKVQWLGGATLMALPFYAVAAQRAGLPSADVAILLAAQTAGAIASNPLWGWLGDRAGKRQLLEILAVVRILPPLIALALLAMPTTLIGFIALFIIVGAMMNGITIGYLGYLMEISPDDRRPAYSAYFNVLASPASLLPLAGGVLAAVLTIELVFMLAIGAAGLQILLMREIARFEQ